MTMAWQAILTKQPIDDSILRDFASHNKKESIMSTRAPLRTSDPKTSVLPRWVLQTKQPPPRESDAVNPKHRQHNGMTASQSLHGIVSLALCFRILPLVEHPASGRHGHSASLARHKKTRGCQCNLKLPRKHATMMRCGSQPGRGAHLAKNLTMAATGMAPAPMAMAASHSCHVCPDTLKTPPSTSMKMICASRRIVRRM